MSGRAADTTVLFGDVLTGEEIKKNHFVSIRGNKILSVSSKNPAAGGAVSEYLFKGKTIIPGLVDLHVHGILDNDLLSGDPSQVLKLSAALARFGVTGFLPTLQTAGRGEIGRGIGGVTAAAREDITGAKILGIHLEGPFINKEKAGAQDAKHVAAPRTDILRMFIERAEGALKIVTLAPELKGGLKLVELLNEHGVVPSIGHTNASFEEARIAVDAGVRYAAHLANAMPQIHQRAPGVVGALLLDPRVYVELIADGVHLHPAFVKMAAALKGPDKVIGVTDSVNGIPQGKRSFRFGGREALVMKDRYAYRGGTIAASCLSMNKALKNMADFTGKGVCEVIKSFTLNPAKVLGLEDKKGSIEAGKDADIAVVDGNFDVLMTMVEGQVAFQG